MSPEELDAGDSDTGCSFFIAVPNLAVAVAVAAFFGATTANSRDCGVWAVVAVVVWAGAADSAAGLSCEAGITAA